MQNILKDLKFALRQLSRAPGFALTAVLTLALGIGANTAIFSLLDQALLRSLPVRDPGSLAVLRVSSDAWSGSISMGANGDQNDYFSYPQYVALRDHGHDFSGLLATTSGQVGFTRNTDSQFVSTEYVSGNYFEVLGVLPSMGRTLLPSDDGQPRANPVAVLSYGFWQGKLGGDPAVVGSTVMITGHPFRIVGVAAPRFTSAIWGQSTGVFVPMSMLQQGMPQAGDRYLDHSYRWLSILGRLRPGISTEQAAAANAPLWHAFRVNDENILPLRSARSRADFLATRLEVLPGARGFSFNRSLLEKPFLAVMAMAVLVLLIAAVNVASLLLVRAAGRAREFSLRAALGASSARIVSQLLLEGVLLGMCGGLVGIALAPFAVRLLISRLSDQGGQSVFSSVIDHRVLMFNFAVVIVVSLLFSLAPALQLRRPNLTSTLRESTGTGGSGLLRLRRTIACLQIGLSVLLLVGAGLFIRTMQQLRAVDVGFDTTHLVTFNIDPELAGYSAAATPGIQQRLLDGLAAMPGISAVAASDTQELMPEGNFYGIRVTGYEALPDESYQVQNTTVTTNYLSTMRIPLLAGRGLTDEDDRSHPAVALVDQTFVKHYCGGSNASCLGRHISYSARNPAKVDLDIVGIFEDYRTRGIREDISAILYRPLKQNPDASEIYLYLKTRMAPSQAMSDIRNTLHSIDPKLPIGEMITMDQQIDADLQNERMITLLAVAFGALATALAGVGLYGVLAYSTAQRTRDIGIRMALGSSRLRVARLILADVLGLAGIGICVAIPVAYGLSILIRSQLFGVSAVDPTVLGSVVAIIVAVALVSALVPARRAAKVSPTEALRRQ